MVIKRTLPVLVGIILTGCLSKTHLPQRGNDLLWIKNYACYYGTGRVEDLAKYDLVIIQDNYSAKEIATLRKGKTIVLGYISLGEDYPLKQGDGTGPGGYASWYLDYFIGDGTKNPGKDNKPDKPEKWISYYVNLADPKWQDLVLSKMDNLISKGFDGAFLDVVGFHPEYPDELKEKVLEPGLLELIRRLRLRHPKSYLVTNRNYYIKEIHDWIDGVMFESFSSYGVKWDEQSLVYTKEQANKINKIRGYPENPNMVVIALDYVKKGDFDLIAFNYERARSFGFISGVSYTGSYLTDLCMVNPANQFEAKREKDGVLLSWQAPEEYVEESMVSHYVIRRSSTPINSEADLKKAFVVSDEITAGTTSFKDTGAPKGRLYYTLQAFNQGGMELVGHLTACVKRD